MISRKARSISSDYHFNKSHKLWKQGEDLFSLVTGLTPVKGRKNIDHIDFICNGELGIFGNVDVKGYKASHKKGLLLLEMLNVQGRGGWCSKDSKADFIAFLFEEHFIVVPRTILRGIVAKKCGKVEGVYRDKKVKPEDGVYKWIGRKNRKDAFTYVPLEDLKPYEEEITIIEV